MNMRKVWIVKGAEVDMGTHSPLIQFVSSCDKAKSSTTMSSHVPFYITTGVDLQVERPDSP